MKVVFNSREKNAPCTIFYEKGFSYCKEITLYDVEHFHEYDVALFMTYKQDLEDLKTVKQSFPKIKTAIIDPRGNWVKPYLHYTDYLIVDSLEMMDFWAFSKKPMFEYIEYPDITTARKNHCNSDKVIIGYHGNKIHLECMYERITPALELLAQKYEIEFWAMYNIADLGKWDIRLPKNFKVRHIQWSMENFHEVLTKVDIGINPCFIPVESSLKEKMRFAPWSRDRYKFGELPDDYVLRFKMPSNPGRIIVWGVLGIPVVSDFIPSAIRCIENGNSGFLAYHVGGWYNALERLILDKNLRQKCSDKMQAFVSSKYSFSVQNSNLIEFLSTDNKILTNIVAD